MEEKTEAGGTRSLQLEPPAALGLGEGVQEEEGEEGEEERRKREVRIIKRGGVKIKRSRKAE